MQSELERYGDLYPQDRAALAALQRILAFQAELAAPVESVALVSPSYARDRWQAGRPLFSSEPVKLSRRWLRAALIALRPWLPHDEQVRATLDCLLAADLLDSPAEEACLGNFGRNGKRCLQEWAAVLAADFDVLYALLHMVVSPFYQQMAVPYRPWIEAAGWRRGFCPLCGAEPSLARLAREDGRRVLVCSLCRSEWSFDRLRCPYCEADNAPQTRYFTVEGDPAHRVDCCGRCRRYLITIDERGLDYRPHIASEEIVTARLGWLAREQGYQ
jgi:formate dehydrogenase maturation protein FdhE